MRLDFSRASTSSAVDLEPGAKALLGEFFGGRQRTAGRIELDQRVVGGLGFDLPVAQAPQRALRFRQRGFVRARRLDAAAAKRAHRFRGAGDAAAAIELGDARLRACDVALQPGDLGREQVRAPSSPHRGRPRDRRSPAAASLARSSRPPSSAAVARVSRSAMRAIGRLEPAAFLLVLRDRQRQRPLAALDGGGRVAHLLVEDQKRRPVFQFLARGSHAAAEKRQNSFEHLLAPCYERCSQMVCSSNLEHRSRNI